MSDAVFSVKSVGPFVTIQDVGRSGYMRFGVPTSGPMDSTAFAAANAALGMNTGQTAIEISLGGLVLNCESGSVTLAVTGGDFKVQRSKQTGTPWRVLTVREGDTVIIRPGQVGSWAYLAFAGTLNAAQWLNSSATHALSDFGGGALKAGQRLVVSNTAILENREGEIAKPNFQSIGPIRAVLGPQDHQFVSAAKNLLLSEPFMVSDSYDRMGMRLKGPALELDGALSIPSEPVVKGSVQVSGDGIPTVLLADHQTTGGYPKIATVISSDIDRLSQFRSGAEFRFKAITHEEALTETRALHRLKTEYLDAIKKTKTTLAQRLMSENLNSAYSGPM